MKAYAGSFKKKNGELRNMLFAAIQDLPDSFLDNKIIGSGAEKSYPEGMQLVWDIEADGFRIFNWNTVQGDIKELEINEDYFT